MNDRLAFLSRKDDPERKPERPLRAKRDPGQPGAVAVTLRLFSLALIVAALLLLAIDMLSSLESGTLVVRSLQQVWTLADGASLARFTGWMAGHGGLAAADSVLALPGWGITGVLGVLIAFLAGRNGVR